MRLKYRILALLSTVVAAGTVLAALRTPCIEAANPIAAPAPLSPQLAADKDLFDDRCSACHGLPDPVAKAYNRDQWQRTVARMINKYQADITPDDASKIVDYLATFTPAGGSNAPTDPWAASADDVWQTMPTNTQIFTFAGPGALSGLMPEAAGQPGPGPHWSAISADGIDAVSVSLPSPSPDRFALLVNRGATCKNLDIRTRFEITKGNVSPAVGIVFGYVDPTHYYVVRYAQQEDDLTLIKINGANHTTLQQTARTLTNPALPPAAGLPNTAIPGAVVSAPANAQPAIGWHVLRVQINNDTIKAWIDRSKRINIADSTYVGGKVGLWTQGDTNALFNNWIVDQYDNEPAPNS